MNTDHELLQAYARARSDDTFRPLIDRHLSLVYAACVRQLRDKHLAEDAAQAVFILMSEKAARLDGCRLPVWLLATARYTCSNIRKIQQRRARREQVVAMPIHAAVESDPSDILPLLDEALHHLPAADREAVILRYLQERPLKEVGASLGLSEDAARKRVDRSLDRLRAFFLGRGLEASSLSIAGLMTTQAKLIAAHTALRESLTHAILQSSHAGAASAGLSLAKAVKAAMTAAKLKTTAGIIAALAVSVTTLWAVSASAHLPPAKSDAPLVPIAAPAQTAPASNPATTLDLSSPENALASMSKALKAADIKLVYETLLAPQESPPNALDAAILMNIAQNHLITAVRAKFPDHVDEIQHYVPLDVALDIILSIAKTTRTQAVIEGDNASVTLEFPDYILKIVPEDARKDFAAWSGKPLKFVRQDGNWKVDNSPSAMHISITAVPLNGRKNVPPEAALAGMLEDAAVVDRVATDIENGALVDWPQVARAYQGLKNAANRKRNFIVSDMSVTPADSPATQP